MALRRRATYGQRQGFAVSLARRHDPWAGHQQMTSRYQICCVTRSDRLNHHERIRTIGGINPDGSRWKISHRAAIDGIEAGHWSFYVAGTTGLSEIVVAVSKYGRKYLKGAEDRLHPDSLLALPECL
jgi:Protein of unknown function (DUF3892)